MQVSVSSCAFVYFLSFLCCWCVRVLWVGPGSESLVEMGVSVVSISTKQAWYVLFLCRWDGLCSFLAAFTCWCVLFLSKVSSVFLRLIWHRCSSVLTLVYSRLCLLWVLVSDLVSVCASFPCRSDRFRLVIAACASSLATNILILFRFSLLLHHFIHVLSPLEQLCQLIRYSPQRKLCCVMLVCYSYLNQRGLSHLEVDRVFGLRLLGLCALVASFVLLRIGFVQVVWAGAFSSLSRLSSCAHLEMVGFSSF